MICDLSIIIWVFYTDFANEYRYLLTAALVLLFTMLIFVARRMLIKSVHENIFFPSEGLTLSNVAGRVRPCGCWMRKSQIDGNYLGLNTNIVWVVFSIRPGWLE